MPDLSPVSAESPGQARRHAPSPVTAVPVRPGGVRRSTVYLDHLASTPCDPEAAALMHRLSVELCGNASSPHAAGGLAARHVDRAREQVAAAIDALPEEIVFTSGATESNNLAILGVAAAARDAGREGSTTAALTPVRKRVLTLGIEHPSVLAPVAELGRRGYDVEHVSVRRDGRVDLDALEDALARDDVFLLSIQAANNEIGTIQPLAEASRMAAERGVIVHSDAAQILGKAPFSVEALNLDLVSLSAHKAYGPNGAGALWIRGGPLRAPIRPLTFGGGHEHGLRPGTLNAPAIAAFGLAAEIAMERLEADAARIGALRDGFEGELMECLDDRVRINGAIDHRLPHATSLTLFDPDGQPLDADALIANLPDFDLSTASACHAGTPEPSHVLRALGMSTPEAYGTLRVGLGRRTHCEAIGRLLERLLSQPLTGSATGSAWPKRGSVWC